MKEFQLKMKPLLALLLVMFELNPALAAAPLPSLKKLAKERGVLFGSAIDPKLLFKDPEYAKHVRTEFSIITPENALKFRSLVPEKGQYDFSVADKIVNFARAEKIAVRGHTLVWHNPEALPAWIKGQELSPDELRNLLKSHIEKTLTHFKKSGKGVLRFWDVANEAFDQDGNYRKDSIWAPIAPDAVTFLSLIFRWAHAADSKVKLFYNDYDIERPGKKSTAVYEVLKALKKKGVPIHGIGFQMHHGPEPEAHLSEMKKVLKKFAALGLEIHITEYDFAVEDSLSEKEALEKQAAAYFDTANLCVSNPACKAFVTWGFTDKDSWVPKEKPGLGRATYLTEAYAPKPAYFSLKKAFSKKR